MQLTLRADEIEDAIIFWLREDKSIEVDPDSIEFELGTESLDGATVELVEDTVDRKAAAHE